MPRLIENGYKCAQLNFLDAFSEYVSFLFFLKVIRKPRVFVISVLIRSRCPSLSMG